MNEYQMELQQELTVEEAIIEVQQLVWSGDLRGAREYATAFGRMGYPSEPLWAVIRSAQYMTV